MQDIPCKFILRRRRGVIKREVPTKTAAEHTRSEAFRVLKALADQTRFEIYCLVQASPTPVSVQQIAEKLGIHPNTARPHLDRLKEAGLVVTEPELSGKVGRPIHLYSATSYRPTALIGDRVLRILRGVIRDTLAELISEYRVSPQEAYELGKIWGRQIRKSAEGERPASQPPRRAKSSQNVPHERSVTQLQLGRRSMAVISEDLELLGFEPSVEGSDDEQVVFFGDCPYRDLALAAPEIVCTVHRAICEESLASVGEGIKIAQFHSIESGEPCRAILKGPGPDSFVLHSRTDDAETVKSRKRRKNSEFSDGSSKKNGR
ncbi:MAG: hypothetical protein C4319_02260 [Acidimicrobiia bacterium]